MKNTVIKVVLAVCAILVVIGLLCSQHLALLAGGFSLSAQTITEYTDREGVELKALLTSADGSPALVLLEKVFPGIWTLQISDRADHPSLPGWASIAWTSWGSSRWHETGGLLSIAREWHYVYACNNAKKLLTLDPNLLPGITADIWQKGEEYYIHIITYRDDLQFNIYDLLLEEGLITDTRQAS